MKLKRYSGKVMQGGTVKWNRNGGTVKWNSNDEKIKVKE